jgi:hypothetical protein
VGFGEEEVGAVNEGDARGVGQGSDQGWGGAEGEVLQVERADVGRVDLVEQGSAQGVDVLGEGRP